MTQKEILLEFITDNIDPRKTVDDHRITMKVISKSIDDIVQSYLDRVVERLKENKTVDATFPEVPMPSYEERQLRTREYNRGLDKAITLLHQEQPEPILESGTRTLEQTIETVKEIQKKVEHSTSKHKNCIDCGTYEQEKGDKV